MHFEKHYLCDAHALPLTDLPMQSHLWASVMVRMLPLKAAAYSMQEEATQLLFQIKFHFYLKLISLEVNNAFKHCDLLMCWSDWRRSARGWCEFPYHHVAIFQRSCTGHAHSTLCYGSGNGPFLCPDWLLNRLNLCVSEIQFVCICWQMYMCVCGVFSAHVCVLRPGLVKGILLEC